MPNIRDRWDLPIGDWQFNVILNQFSHITPVKVYGNGVNIGTVEPRTIWDYVAVAGVLYPTSTSIGSAAIASRETADNVTGTGAQKILVEGVDINFNPISEVISMNGGTPVQFTEEFYRFNSAQVIQTGTTGTNEGGIFIGGGTFSDSGVPNSRHMQIQSGTGLQSAAIYTVPVSHTALFYPNNFVARNDTVDFSLWLTVHSNGSSTKKAFNLPGAEKIIGQGFPILINEKTDIEIRGIASTGTPEASIFADLLLIDNTFFSTDQR